MTIQSPRSRCNCGSGLRFRDCCQQRKAHSQTLTFDMGVPRSVDAVRMTPDGRIEVLSGGEVLEPVRVWTGNQRAREKGGEKTLFSVPVSTATPKVGEISALSEYRHIFVIDTNSKQIPAGMVSVASIAVCTPSSIHGDQVLVRKRHVGAFEFRGMATIQERFGWFLLQHAILTSPDHDPAAAYLIVTDHDLRAHPAINDREEPLYGETRLAPGLTLGFATSESGRSFLQKTIRECDGFAKKILRAIESGDQTDDALRATPGAPVTHLRLFQYKQPADGEQMDRMLRSYALSASFPY